MYARILSALVLISSLSAVAGAPPLDYRSSADIKRVFADPPSEYGTAPLWVWNDNLTDVQVLESLRDFARQKVTQVFVHPRPGLMTPYLSDEWFRLWKLALAEAERLGLYVWIYDENSYPSGFAGGFVPEAMPESRGRGLDMQETAEPPDWSETLLAVFRLTEGGYEDVSARIRDGRKQLPSGRYLSVSVARAKPSPWYGGRFYVDLLYPGVTQKFLEVTLDRYKREIGDQFGKRVPGSFTDEPQLRPAGGLPWTDDLPAQFEKRWGYRLTDHLPTLWDRIGDWKKVRHNYFQTLLDLFIERWARPYYAYCEKNQLEFTGHYWEHEWPQCVSVPDNMALSAWQQRPGIDILMNLYKEDTHAQFGNVRSVKEISSLANQLGRRRALCEAYGAGGWDLRFEDMKRIGDWMYALGVNTLDQHLAYVSLRGARKRDHPQSFSYHEPWWDAYHTSATYFSRLSLALSQGEQINHILVLEPTTTAWMYNAMRRGSPTPDLEKIGEAFQSLVVDLEKAQVEFDLACEDVMARHGSVEGKKLKIGQRAYELVVIPPMTENLNSATAALLTRYLDQGGILLSCSQSPERVDGISGQRAVDLRKVWMKPMAVQEVINVLRKACPDGLKIDRKPGDQGILYHHRRHLHDGDLLFLVNSSIDQPTAGTVSAEAAGLEQWDLNTGKIKEASFTAEGKKIQFAFELPPSGSRLFFLSRKKRKPAVELVLTSVPVPASGAMSIKRTGPNVLILDYLDLEVGGQKLTSSYFYPAGQLLFTKNGFDRNPWDSAVQFRDELISKAIPPNDGFVARYRFTIEGEVPDDLALVVERPDLYLISCNGHTIKPAQGQWWLDRAFGKMSISSAARVGPNEVVLRAAQFSIYHELEAAYLLGSFRLKAALQGFVVTPDTELQPGPWNGQGMPFYSHGVVYSSRFNVEKAAAGYEVRLPYWYGSVAKVSVNGREAGPIAAPPHSLDVTGHIKPGTNYVEVLVVGTLKNTLGPHHGKPALGTAWPAMFAKGPQPGPPPGHEYSTVGYGLFQSFQLVELSVHDRK
ncbi:MAG: glycosyl hydrolase [Acidobacteriota bacterium]